MSNTETHARTDPTDDSNGAVNSKRPVWALRAPSMAFTLAFIWLAFHLSRYGALSLLIIPLAVGSLVAALRLPAVTGRVNSIETWLHHGLAKSRGKQGAFVRFIQRPFFRVCLFSWRLAVSVPDEHVRAGARLAMLLLFWGIVTALLIVAAYAFVVIIFLIAALALVLWILMLWLGGGSAGKRVQVTRYGKDWFGQPKEEHFDTVGNKIGESTPTVDWLGRPKTVHRDTDGNIVGESKPDEDWLGNPKTVHRDTQGNSLGESKPDTDWFGNPKTVHTDADGNVTGESRDEADIFGKRRTVRYKK